VMADLFELPMKRKLEGCSMLKSPWQCGKQWSLFHYYASTPIHITLINFQGQRSTCRGRGHIVTASRTACFVKHYIQNAFNNM